MCHVFPFTSTKRWKEKMATAVLLVVSFILHFRCFVESVSSCGAILKIVSIPQSANIGKSPNLWEWILSVPLLIVARWCILGYWQPHLYFTGHVSQSVRFGVSSCFSIFLHEFHFFYDSSSSDRLGQSVMDWKLKQWYINMFLSLLERDR